MKKHVAVYAVVLAVLGIFFLHGAGVARENQLPIDYCKTLSYNMPTGMDLVIDTLIVDEHRLEHIARHQVTIEEVHEIVSGDYAYIQGHHERWLLIGKTSQGRFLTVVVGARSEPNTYGLVTARPASREERSFYRELALEGGGEEHGQN